MYPEVHKSDYLMTSMNKLTESLRSLSISLYPIDLDREGFKSSIIDYIQIFNTNKLPVTLNIDEGHLSKLDKNPKYILFAAVQNIISRLLKESHVHFIQITSMARRGRCILSVSDDSDRPISEEESDECKDLAILIDFIERELFMFDGSFQVSHVEGKGRNFQLSIPIL